MDKLTTLQLTTASSNDFLRLAAFYKDVIERTPGMSSHCPWVYGLHPTDEMIINYIKEGSMYLCLSDGIILGSVAVTPYQSEEYDNIKWPCDSSIDDIAVVHILAVNPDYQKGGLARMIMQEVENIAANFGHRVLRLDALSINTPAQKLYTSLGFHFCDRQMAYARNLGITEFFYFEKKTSRLVYIQVSSNY